MNADKKNFVEIKAINQEEAQVSLDGMVIDRPYQDDGEVLEVLEVLRGAYPSQVKFHLNKMRLDVQDKVQELAELDELGMAKATVRGYIIF